LIYHQIIKRGPETARITLITRDIARRQVANGEWVKETLSDLWDINAQKCPEREALVSSRERLTWREANLQATRVALGFRELGFERDDVLAIQVPSCIDAFILRTACTRAGIIFTTPPMTLLEQEMEFVLTQTRAKGVVIPHKWRGRDYYQKILDIRPGLPHLEHIFISNSEAPPGTTLINDLRGQSLEEEYPNDYLEKVKFKADESMLLMLTGGTTGVPKIVEAPCNARLTAYYRLATEFLCATADDIIGVTFHHPVGPLSQAYYVAPLLGMKVAILDRERFEPEQVFQFIHQERVTWLPLVPTLLVQLVEAPHLDEYLNKFDISSLRLIVISAAPLPLHIAKKAEQRLGAKVVNHFGITDALCITGSSIEAPAEVRWKTVGKMPGGGEIKLVDDEGREVPEGEVGEIRPRGPFVVGAYFNNPKATKKAWTEDGSFITGDLGKFDKRGNLILVGREKDMIIRGGQNIYPGEIEELLLTHPKIADVAVVGMPDLVMGERACAFIATRAGVLFTFEEMVDFLKAKKIAMFKIPERLELVSDIPRVPETKKTDKKLLRQLIAEKLKSKQET
jgi:acyl-CoA synthetase (AMP-forming)/AMP-acid ligase II